MDRPESPASPYLAETLLRPETSQLEVSQWEQKQQFFPKQWGLVSVEALTLDTLIATGSAFEAKRMT